MTKIALIRVMGLVVLATLVGACQRARQHQRGMSMEEYFTGRSIVLESAAATASQIVVGKLVNTGQPDPGAPGQTYYDNASAEIVRWLHGAPRESERPRTVSFAYTVQKLPAAAAEQGPAVGRTYILFLTERVGGTMRAVKILPAEERHLRAVERALH